jgi:hypothetical protein
MRRRFDTFNHDERGDTGGKSNQMVKAAEAARSHAHIPQNTGIDLDDVDLNGQQAGWTEMTCAKIVDRNPAAERLHFKKPFARLTVPYCERPRFGDLKHEPRRQLASFRHLTCDGRPRVVVRKGVRANVATENFRFVDRQFVKNELHHVPVEQGRYAGRFQCRNKIRSRPHRTSGIDNPRQAFAV